MGYTRVEMSFSGSLNVKQTGHAVLHLDKYGEDYLIPFADCKIKGFLSGSLYPELGGTCQIISSTGFVSEISFSGQGFFSGLRNSFKAKMYRATDNLKTTIFTASGQWSGEFTIRNSNDDKDVVTCVATSPPAAPLQTSDIAAQDPWETRNAWKDVLLALVQGDMQKIVKEKTKLEEAQRAMRGKEAAEGVKWEPKFFSSTGDDDPVFRKLGTTAGWQLHAERTKGVWRFDREKAEKATKPYHGDLTPFG
jgi:oxysterol-binding protein-related protein 9/10/11